MSEKNAQLDRIDRYARLIEQQCGKAVRPYRHDGYVNLLNRYGTQKDTSERYNFQAEPTIPDDQLAMFYEGNGLFAKIIDTPAEEAIKHGFKLQNVADQKIEDFFTEALDELDWEETAMTAVKWARLFGGSIAVMLINDGCESLDMPLDWKNIRSIDDIRVFDRSLIQPDYQSMFNYDPKNPFATRGSRLGMPEFFDVTSKYGNFRVHESRCLVFQNGILPENTTNSVYQMWGMPEYVRLHRAIRDAELSHGNAAKMLDRSIQAVYKMQGLSNLLQTEQGEGQVLRRLQTIDMARGLLNSITIDADGEDYDFRTFQLNGVSEVVNASCNFLSALSNIPQTLLFGRSPAGMNATGDGDMENYYNFCERIQKRMIRPNLRYLLSVIFQAGMATGEIDEIPKIKVDFNPLWSLSELEEANLEQTKANTQKIKADTANVYVNMQAVDPSEVRKKLADSDEFDIEDVLDEYSDEELFPPEPEVPVDENGNPIQPAETDQIAQGVNLNAHNGQPDDTGTAPAAAPAATKLPEDFSAQEAEIASSIVEQAEDTPIINQDGNSGSVGVLVISEGKILSATRHNDFGYGLICGPGGHIEPGETAEAAAIRETQEEFGIKPVNLIPLGQGPTEPDTGLTPELFLCTEFEGEVSSPDLEMAAPKFRSMEELSELTASMFQPFADGLQILMECIGEVKNDGGPGSGNWGHEGRPGQIGGSKDGGGSHNRLKDKSGCYTSFSKERKKFATPHKITKDEISKLKTGAEIVTSMGYFVKEGNYFLVNYEEGLDYSPEIFVEEFAGEDVRVLIPDTENKNFRKEKIRTNDQFSESRKKAAFSTSDRKEADAMFRENTGKVWQKLPSTAKAALVSYTGDGYHAINGGLRNGSFIDKKSEKQANLMAKAINKIGMPTDAYLQRGSSISSLAKLVGNTDLNRPEDFQKYVGVVVKDNGFLSCGTAEDTGMTGRDVQWKIYCPKGTKAIYAEPFSAWGESGEREGWDGKSGQKYFSGEFETILQRGTSLQITRVNENEYGELEVDAQVVSQDPVTNSTPPKKDEDDLVHDGGPGSGNHGHKGVPGQVGGSAPSGSAKSKSAASFSKKTVKQKADILIRAKDIDLPKHLNQRSYAQRVAYSLGINGKPEVLSPDDFDAKVSAGGKTVIYRGVRHTENMTAEEIVDMTIHGEHTYYGNGQNGDGIYFSTVERDADSYAGISGRYKQDNPGAKMQAFLNDNAKIITTEKLEEYLYDFSSDAYVAQLRNAGAVTASDDDSVLALSLGYNVIQRTNQFGESFYNVLDRTALTCRDNSRADAMSSDAIADTELAETFNGFAAAEPDTENKDGGPGSGNHGHKGVPGKVGGSAPSKRVYASKDFQKGTDDFELTGDVRDMNLTSNARKRVEAAIAKVKTASDLEKYLADKGIRFVTSHNALQQAMDREIPSVKQQIDYVVAAVEQYEDLGGLQALKAIHFFEPELDAQAQYSYRATGEEEVDDEGHLYISYRANGFQVMHEFAHAYADSSKPAGMDVVEWSAELNKIAKLSDDAHAYFGANAADAEAERFADAFGGAFAYGQGNANRVDFVVNVANSLNGKNASGKPVADRSAKDFTPKQSAYASDEFKAISKQITDARAKSDDAYKQVKDLKEKLVSETTFKPRSEWTEEDEIDDLLGNRPRKYTAEGERIKAELDKAIQTQVAAIDEKDAALEAAYQFKERIRAEQVKNFHPGSPKPATKDDYDGFTLAKTSNGMADDYLASGDAYIAEMSPKEYIERCAFEIFESGTLESTMGAVSEDTARKYAKQMSDGVKFDLPYLDYSGQGQEGRHRAVAAYLAGIDTMPVLIIGEPPHADCADDTALDGGKGSGNFGHKGRPGQIGGSSNSGSGLNDKISSLPDIGKFKQNPVPLADRDVRTAVAEDLRYMRDENDLGIQNVPVKKISTLQKRVNGTRLAQMAEAGVKSGTIDNWDEIEVVLHRGQYVLTDGNHRVALALLKGENTVEARVRQLPETGDDVTNTDGGKGSGNWGHEGRPGKVGGSAEGGGAHNRLGDKQKGYTSFSKEKKKFATPHKPEKHEFSRLPNEAVVITPYGSWQHYKTAGYYMCKDTGEVIWDKDMYDGLADEEIRVIIPDSENRNYRKFKLSDAEQFSEERKKAAFSTKSPAEADAKFRENTGKVWRNLDDDSRHALYVYTTNSYRSINTSLRTGQSAGKHYDGYIEKMTAAIDQCELPCDAYLFRGSSISALGKLLGNPHLSNTDDLDRYVGRVVKDKAFLSTGTAEGTGMDDNVSYRIYCPKGTKAIYAEPFSSFNKYGDKNKWNGIDGQSGFSYEDETILQRGTSLQILSVTRDGKWGIHVEAQVVSQDHD